MRTFRGKRALLNQTGHHSTGAIVLEIEDMRGHEDSDNYVMPPEVIFAISDCERTITFELDFRSEGERDNALFKIDTLMDVLKAGRKALVAEQKFYVKRRLDKEQEVV